MVRADDCIQISLALDPPIERKNEKTGQRQQAISPYLTVLQSKENA
jgi:hypothetical protein